MLLTCRWLEPARTFSSLEGTACSLWITLDICQSYYDLFLHILLMDAAEFGKVTIKGNGDEAISDESL